MFLRPLISLRSYYIPSSWQAWSIASVLPDLSVLPVCIVMHVNEEVLAWTVLSFLSRILGCSVGEFIFSNNHIWKHFQTWLQAPVFIRLFMDVTFKLSSSLPALSPFPFPLPCGCLLNQYCSMQINSTKWIEWRSKRWGYRLLLDTALLFSLLSRMPG